MALPTALDKRPLPAGSLAARSAPVKPLNPEERYSAEHLALGLPDYAEYLQAEQEYLQDCATWYIGWEILSRSGYDRELWLGADAVAALAEWRELWGGAPCVAVPRPTRQHISSSDVYTPEWAAALAASIANITPDEPPTSPMIPPAAPPQDLQDNHDIASAIAATAQKLAATPENIQAAAKAKFDDDGPEPEYTSEAEAWLDRFLEDVRDGLSDFDQRKNKHGVVLLRTRIWLRKGSHDIYLERDGLAQGVIVCTQAPTGTWVPTVHRDEIRDWLKLKPGPSAKEVPAAASRAAALGLPATGAALDEIGEYARNAPEEDGA